MSERETHPTELEVLLEELKAELDEAVAARKRALADFANYQKRACEMEVRAVETGAASVLRSLLGVLDHFDLALEQKTEKITVEQLLGGVRIVRDELTKAMESHGVARIEPRPGDEFDPNRHEAVMHQPAEGVAPNHIAALLQPGYTMGEFVLRPAKVSVVAPAAHDSEET